MLKTNKTPYQFDMSFPKDDVSHVGDVSHVQYHSQKQNLVVQYQQPWDQKGTWYRKFKIWVLI
jgi:hypothetical protein